MAYPATQRFNYLAQFGILAVFVGAGIVISAILSLIPVLNTTGLSALKGASSEEVMDSILKPENAGILRVVQFLTTLFAFFLPAFFYAKLCHRKAFVHLGMKKQVTIPQILIVILIMIVSLPLVGMLGQLTESLPFSASTLEKFKRAEEEYLRQVEIIGRMNDFKDFLLSLFMLAILPAVFEETIFRGALQNLLSRWWKIPLLAVIVTSIIFSVIHFSYIGFMSRAVLGFLLGWLYHRTGNLWLSIIGHVTNNAIAITALYVMKLRDPAVKLSDAGPEFPLWSGIISLVGVIALLTLFERVSQYQVVLPGKEVPIENKEENPFVTVT